MTGPRSVAALLGAASVLACGCSPSGGGAASSQPAASSAPPAASSAPAAASDTAASSAAASDLPPVAAAPAAAPAATPAAAPAPPKPEPTAAELLRNDPVYVARDRRLEALYGNAKDRDPTGVVEQQQTSALAERRACADRACLDRWFSRREAALKQYVEN